MLLALVYLSTWRSMDWSDFMNYKFCSECSVYPDCPFGIPLSDFECGFCYKPCELPSDEDIIALELRNKEIMDSY